MAGQTATRFAPGDRCVIHVNDVNSPTGWWWGVVDEFVWSDFSGGSGKAHITGPFVFNPNAPWQPLYGDANIEPTVNYNLYGIDKDTVHLVQMRIRAEKQENAELNRLRVANEELRSVLKSMALTPDKIVEAVREALKAEERR
jgi:hypothetical protein